MADDGKHGTELWKSNGTKEGTHLVKNITPGIDPSYLNYMVNVKDKLLFTMNDILWQSDGTKEGTHPVHDKTLNGVTNINNLVAAEGRLYFSGYTNTTGQELYTGKISSCFASLETFAKSTSVVSSPKINTVFEARLLTNPINDRLKFSVSIKNQQAAQLIIVDASGRILKSEKQTLSPGTNTFSYDAKSWAHGLYMVRIVAADGSSSLLKAVK
jgi:ELWxxDGT repeat protein